MGFRSPVLHSAVLVALMTALFVGGLPSVAAAQDRFDVDLGKLPDEVSENDLRRVDGLHYESDAGELVWLSDHRMSEDDRDRLLGMSQSPAWRAAVRELHDEVETVHDRWHNDDDEGELFSLKVEDFPLTTALVAIADVHKLNIVCAPEVKGSITLHIKNVPVMVAIRTMARSAGYDIVEIPNRLLPDEPILLVVPAKELEPERVEQVITVPAAAPGRGDLDFDRLVVELEQLLGDGDTVVANQNSRVVLVSAPEETVGTVKQYIEAVHANLPRLDGLDGAAGDSITTRVFTIPDTVEIDGVSDGLTSLRSVAGKLAVNVQARVVVVRDSSDVVDLMETYLEAVIDAAEND